MTFSDIFKSGFLESITAVSVTDMAVTLGLSFLLGFFIYFVYKKSYKGVMYSSSFGTTLIALTMITALVILAITSNVILSLGMVGALSIVRFRTAIKEPLDIAFLFWAIAAGIVLAAGMIPLALLGSAIIGGVILLFANRKSHFTPYILVLSCENSEAETEAVKLIESKVKKHSVKSKTVSKGQNELTLEVRLNDENTGFINDLSALSGVNSAVLVSYSGEYMS